MYAVKEIFLTIQGEGFHAGRVAVFLRFSGCNLWNGRPEDRGRAPGSCARWCDTDFLGTDGPRGGHYLSAHEVAKVVEDVWMTHAGRGERSQPFVVITGGEPLLQLDTPLIDALHERGFGVAVETNGTRMPPVGIDWLCVSPKAYTDLIVTRGDELKLVVFQPGADPERFEGLSFTHFSLQPLDDGAQADHTKRAVEYCLSHPKWRLSLQLHKMLGIP